MMRWQRLGVGGLDVVVAVMFEPPRSVERYRCSYLVVIGVRLSSGGV